MSEQKGANGAPESKAEGKNTPPKVFFSEPDNQEILALDPESLDPNLHYRFVLDSQSRISRRAMEGYQVVSASQSGVRTMSEAVGTNADDRIRVGDCILMACPKERYKARRQKQRKINDMRMSVPEKSFRKKAREKGVKLTDKEGPS